MTAMTFGMALVSRILTGEEPCLRKVQFGKWYKLPVDKSLIENKMKHEYLISQIVNKLKGEVIVNKWVELDLGTVKLVGKIDILLVDDTPTIIEVKSGKGKNSHHVQLWLYMLGFEGDVEGILKYPVEKYWYSSEDIPNGLINLILQRTKPLLTNKLLPAVKGSHCRYCRHRQLCERR